MFIAETNQAKIELNNCYQHAVTLTQSIRRRCDSHPPHLYGIQDTSLYTVQLRTDSFCLCLSVCVYIPNLSVAS